MKFNVGLRFHSVQHDFVKLVTGYEESCTAWELVAIIALIALLPLLLFYVNNKHLLVEEGQTLIQSLSLFFVCCF